MRLIVAMGGGEVSGIERNGYAGFEAGFQMLRLE